MGNSREIQREDGFLGRQPAICGLGTYLCVDLDIVIFVLSASKPEHGRQMPRNKWSLKACGL
jgi:hypothetical protein